MVIIYKIIERAVGYRGSKSARLKNIAVKEQWVYGCLYFFLHKLCLRCILITLEINYLVKTLSKQLNIKNFSGLRNKAALPTKRTYCLTLPENKSSNESNYIYPLFIVGFTDGVIYCGCFMVSVIKAQKFSLKLDEKFDKFYRPGLSINDLNLKLFFNFSYKLILTDNKFYAINKISFYIAKDDLPWFITGFI